MLKHKMKEFEATLNKKYTFSSCKICEARCCNGAKGTLFAQITLEDFPKLYKNFPIVFIFGDLGYLKPVVLLTNGKTFCRYLKDLKCTIYENRPSVCRTYPLSANIDEMIYIDTLCPAVNEKEGDALIKEENFINESFHYESLDNYQEKYINTHFEFDKFNKQENFKKEIELNGLIFYSLKQNFENEYLKMHQDSLIHLQNDYFTYLN